MAQGGGLVHQGILDRQGDDHGGKDFDVAYRPRRHLRVLGKQAHKHRGQGVGHHRHEHTEGHAQGHDRPDGPFDAFQVGRAVVEADHRLAAQGKAAHGHGDEEQVALHDGGAGHQGIPQLRPAVALEHSVQHDQQDAVRGDDEEGGQAEGQHPPHDAPGEAAPPQAHRHPLPPQGEEDEGAGGHLGEHGGQSGPGHVQMEAEDENGPEKPWAIRKLFIPVAMRAKKVPAV